MKDLGEAKKILSMEVLLKRVDEFDMKDLGEAKKQRASHQWRCC